MGDTCQWYVSQIGHGGYLTLSLLSVSVTCVIMDGSDGVS